MVLGGHGQPRSRQQHHASPLGPGAAANPPPAAVQLQGPSGIAQSLSQHGGMHQRRPGLVGRGVSVGVALERRGGPLVVLLGVEQVTQRQQRSGGDLRGRVGLGDAPPRGSGRLQATSLFEQDRGVEQRLGGRLGAGVAVRQRDETLSASAGLRAQLAEPVPGVQRQLTQATTKAGRGPTQRRQPLGCCGQPLQVVPLMQAVQRRLGSPLERSRRFTRGLGALHRGELRFALPLGLGWRFGFAARVGSLAPESGRLGVGRGPPAQPPAPPPPEQRR